MIRLINTIVLVFQSVHRHNELYYNEEINKDDKGMALYDLGKDLSV